MVILRGLPGSGKSHVARLIKDLETQHGQGAPRIHSLDDYFVTVSLLACALACAARVRCCILVWGLMRPDCGPTA